MKTLALIDYGSGNIRSASRALAQAAKLAEIDLRLQITCDPEIIANSDAIFLPGVGHFSDCMKELNARDGVVEVLRTKVLQGDKPFMGICVGMQLLASLGREDGQTPGLSFLAGSVDKLCPSDASLAIPHMGWNEIQHINHALFHDLGQQPHLYFTHSYAFTPEDKSVIAATADYGGAFTAAVVKDNIFGTQFHPEKSQTTGQKLLANFLKWKP
ncbi:imidazole glycerol phosphate synthase subunit HisH [Hirschia litorea]|uniref:Imidazole glycerol phosphate synthase subunit HisH n=1 Tax=Hirschia litorea TaxID=1199156 RepID=A0ABW2IMV0_9PROT